MKVSVRDDAISKNRYTLRVMTLACIGQSITIVLLSGLCLFSFFYQKTVYIPTVSGQSYTMSSANISPIYIQDVANDVMQLRLTWNSDTITQQYQKLISFLKPKDVPYFRALLNKEINNVKNRHMQSVFYIRSTKVDVKDHMALVSGVLQRVDAGVMIKPVHKSYQIKFSNYYGRLYLTSIEEVKANA